MLAHYLIEPMRRQHVLDQRCQAPKHVVALHVQQQNRANEVHGLAVAQRAVSLRIRQQDAPEADRESEEETEGPKVAREEGVPVRERREDIEKEDGMLFVRSFLK